MSGEQKNQSADQQAGWVFKPGGSAAAPQANAAGGQSAGTGSSGTGDSVEWTASEYIAHQKNAGWYFKVAFAAVLIAAVVYLITHDTMSTGFILFAGIVFMVVGARKPRLLAFRLDQGGLTIGQKYYPYSQFKSFAIVQEGPLATIVFLPLKRFVPTVDIYIPPDSADAILNVLSNNLPLETRNPRLVDTVAHRIRFQALLPKALQQIAKTHRYGAVQEIITQGKWISFFTEPALAQSEVVEELGLKKNRDLATYVSRILYPSWLAKIAAAKELEKQNKKDPLRESFAIPKLVRHC